MDWLTKDKFTPSWSGWISDSRRSGVVQEQEQEQEQAEVGDPGIKRQRLIGIEFALCPNVEKESPNSASQRARLER